MALIVMPASRTALPLDEYELVVPTRGNSREVRARPRATYFASSQALALNRPLYAAVGQPTHVQAYWSARGRTLALQPCDATAPGARKCTRRDDGGCTVKVGSVRAAYGLPGAGFAVPDPVVRDGAVFVPWPAAQP